MKLRQAIKVMRLVEKHGHDFARWRFDTIRKARRVCRRLWPKACRRDCPQFVAMSIDPRGAAVLRELRAVVPDWFAELGIPAGLIQGPGVDTNFSGRTR